MERIICIVLLLSASLSDVKTKTISIFTPIAGIAVGVLLLITSENKLSLLYGMIFGTVMLLFSIFSKNNFGVGDGLMIVVMGMLLGIRACFESVIVALILVMLAGVILIVIRKNWRKVQLPFLPFLLVGVIVECFLGGVN